MVKGKQQRKLPVNVCSTPTRAVAETHIFMSCETSYGLGGNYMHFRTDRR